jgi:dihydrodipicolinate synthase/N-acetylneuraminate lyase
VISSMLPFEPGQAKEWARAEWRGLCNIVLPSFTVDLKGLSEAGIRHDVRRNIELGFWGALVISEAGTTRDEYLSFLEIAVDEAAGRQRFLVHGSFDSLEEVQFVAKRAEAIGASGLLMSYPNSFYPRDVSELISYTRAVCDASRLPVVLFCAPHFNLQRLHVSGFPLEAWLELAALDNVVAVKYEVGQPGIVGSLECFRAFSDRGVLVCDPYEPNLLLWAEQFGTPWIGTSNYEYLGSSVLEMLAHANEGRWAAAMDIYWQVHPARRARERLRVAAAGANFNHRYVWKFQGWLQGYNGGPLRAPAMKLTDDQMVQAAQSLVDSALLDARPTDLSAFFTGRNPH